MKYTREYLLSQIKQFFIDNGRKPLGVDFTKSGVPHYKNYICEFGSWRTVLREAGLTADFTFHCKYCDKINKSNDRRKQFCNSSCAASHSNEHRSIESRDKQRKTIIERYGNKDLVSYEIYRLRCNFRFKQKLYPLIPNFELIEQYGFYVPRKRNNGVCRDHMYSVYEGFVNKINPDIISHPANCQFLLCDENSRKSSNSSITLNELLERIRVFNNTNYDFFIPPYDIYVDINVIVDDYRNNRNQNRQGQRQGQRQRRTYEYRTYEHSEIKWSSITGIPYNPKLNPAKGWDNPNMVSARLLSKMFNFDLGNPYTTKRNILNSLEILRYHLNVEKMKPNQIRKMYGVEYKNFNMFLKNVGVFLIDNK